MNLIVFTLADGASIFEPRALKTHAFNRVAAQDFDGLGEELKVHPLRLVAPSALRKLPQRGEIFFLQAALAVVFQIADVFGSLKRAVLVLRRAMDTGAWESIPP